MPASAFCFVISAPISYDMPYFAVLWAVIDKGVGRVYLGDPPTWRWGVSLYIL